MTAVACHPALLSSPPSVIARVACNLWQSVPFFVYTNDRNRYLSRLDYGNGDKVQYIYDKKGRLLRATGQENRPLVPTVFFAEQSKTGGEWDLKAQEAWALDPEQAYRYNNVLLRYDDVGNIHYGYVGRVLFDENTLLLAGGVVQIISGSSRIEYITTNFDDPRDQWAIWYGSYLWDLGG